MAEIKKMGYCVNGEWKESKAEKYMDVTDRFRAGCIPGMVLTFSCKETAVYVQMERRSLCS